MVLAFFLLLESDWSLMLAESFNTVSRTVTIKLSATNTDREPRQPCGHGAAFARV